METAREMLLSAGLWGVASATPDEHAIQTVEKWAAAIEAQARDNALRQPRNWRHKPTEPGWYWRVRLGDQHQRTPDVVLVKRDNDHERSALYWTDYGMAHPVDDPPAYWMRIPEPELPGPPEPLRETLINPDGTVTLITDQSRYENVTFEEAPEPAVGYTAGDFTDPDSLAHNLTDLEMSGYQVIHMQTVHSSATYTPVTRVVWRCTGAQP